jgi:hypothetical protein
MSEFDTWTTIPEFPDYQINVEGDVRFKATSEEIASTQAFDTVCFDLVKDGQILLKTQSGLIAAAKPRAKRWQGVPVKEKK